MAVSKNANFEFSSEDILDSNAFVIVNPVNCVGVMGKGLALQFKKRFPSMYRHYRDYCQVGLLSPGELHTYKIESPTNNTRYIINAATKNHWRDSSNLNIIFSCVSSIRSKINRQLATVYEQDKRDNPSLPQKMEIAIPALGCGEGGLSFDDVWPIMEEHLSRISAKCIIYLPR